MISNDIFDTIFIFNSDVKFFVLVQRNDGKSFVIYYASKTLDSTQMNYLTTEKELFVVVF